MEYFKKKIIPFDLRLLSCLIRTAAITEIIIKVIWLIIFQTRCLMILLL